MKVMKHLSEEELAIRIQKEPNERIKERLCFICHLYDGDGVAEASTTLGYCRTTGYNWLHAWNEQGVSGLQPEFDGGAPPKLSTEEEERFKARLTDNDSWTPAEIHDLLRTEFDIDYSDRHLRRLLDSYGMQYPSSSSEQQTETAAQQLDEPDQEDGER
jgi:putative transposase